MESFQQIKLVTTFIGCEYDLFTEWSLVRTKHSLKLYINIFLNFDVKMEKTR